MKKLYKWLCDNIENKDISQDERIIYCKVLDYIERNISVKEYIS